MNLFEGLYGDSIAIGKKANDLLKTGNYSRSELCDNLRQLYKENGNYFFSSELSWLLQYK